MINGPLKIACYGAGYFSQFHFDAWRRISEARLVGIANRSIDKILVPNVSKFSELSQLLIETQPDILDIITPPVTHLDAIKLALQHGVKAIICQKPFCENKAQAKEAIRCASEVNVPLIVHENFRFQPWYREIKCQIESGAIGDVLQLTFRLRTGDGQGDGAYLDRQPFFREMRQLLVHETGVHWIDTFRFLLGDPTHVFADLRQLNPVLKGEDAGYMLFSYVGGKRALFDGNRLLDHNAKNCRTTLGEALIEGTEGTLELFGDGSVTHRAFGKQHSIDVLQAKDWGGFAGDCVFALQKHVVNGLLHGHRFENEAKDYLRVIEIEEAVYQSAKEHKRVEL
jgi:predicted dehydrogenase